MENNEKTIKELIDSLNESIKDIREHPTEIKELPSNFEILVRGVSDSKALDFLFSTKLDKIIEGLFTQINSGNFEKIIENKDSLESLLNTMFGEGSFKGPVSTTVLNSIQASVQSQRYQTMKSCLGKSMVTLKKINLVMKNLRKSKSLFKDDKEKLKKYKEAVYAIKQVLKFAARVYRNRKIINRKVFNGLNNIVHESLEIDEPLE